MRLQKILAVITGLLVVAALGACGTTAPMKTASMESSKMA